MERREDWCVRHLSWLYTVSKWNNTVTALRVRLLSTSMHSSLLTSKKTAGGATSVWLTPTSLYPATLCVISPAFFVICMFSVFVRLQLKTELQIRIKWTKWQICVFRNVSVECVCVDLVQDRREWKMFLAPVWCPQNYEAVASQKCFLWRAVLICNLLFQTAATYYICFLKNMWLISTQLFWWNKDKWNDSYKK